MMSTWSLLKWGGRTLLWICLPPIGWYRSRQHTQKRRHLQLIEEVRMGQQRLPRPRA